MTETADVSELRDNTQALMRRVSRGEEIALTLDGKPFVRLVPEPPQKAESDHSTKAPSGNLSM
jgi:prevent-host-death family protein